MNREKVIRSWLRSHYPETSFVQKPPNQAGLWFGQKPPNRGPIIPLVHVVTLWNRTAELDDDEFNAALFGVGEIIRLVYDETGRDVANFSDETLDDVRGRMMAEFPDVEEVIARVFDVKE